MTPAQSNVVFIDALAALAWTGAATAATYLAWEFWQGRLFARLIAMVPAALFTTVLALAYVLNVFDRTALLMDVREAFRATGWMLGGAFVAMLLDAHERS